MFRWVVGWCVGPLDRYVVGPLLIRMGDGAMGRSDEYMSAWAGASAFERLHGGEGQGDADGA